MPPTGMRASTVMHTQVRMYPSAVCLRVHVCTACVPESAQVLLRMILQPMSLPMSMPRFVAMSMSLKSCFHDYVVNLCSASMCECIYELILRPCTSLDVSVYGHVCTRRSAYRYEQHA